MKNTFFEHNMHRLGYVDKIKNDSIIILDANALLNLYRYNEENRSKFLEILKQVQNRLFLTNQSVEEFYRNRLNILKDKSRFKDSLKKSINNEMGSIRDNIVNGNFKGDNISSCQLLKYELDLKNKIIEIINNSINEINSEIDSHENGIGKAFLKNDYILDEIISLFDEKVNLKLDKEKLESIYTMGKERYNKKIPPGYEDYKKSESERYGDLIIWNEMMEISKYKNSDILFVSDDTKEDWCEKVSGQNLGPRKELIREFYEETEKFFYSFTTSDFIKHISELHKITNTQNLEKESDIIRESLESISKNNSELVVTSGLASVADQYRGALEAMKVPNIDDYYRSLLKTSGLASVADQYRGALEAMKVPNIDDYYRSLLKTSGLASATDQYRGALEAMKAPNIDDYYSDELELTETSSICEPNNK
ncbi:PIN-like domain-containing protein [Paraclostridium ghonii]|uniref:PIN-like domain-containing protein n=1 Tax=Paraclostridium ghonii TaxID=29358 RepID=UPI003523FA1C